MKHFYIVDPIDFPEFGQDSDPPDVRQAKNEAFMALGEWHGVHLGTAFPGGPDTHLIVLMDEDSVPFPSWEPLPGITDPTGWLRQKHLDVLRCAGATHGDMTYHAVNKVATALNHPKFRVR